MGCHPGLKKCVLTQPRLGGRCSITNNVLCGFGTRSCVPDTPDSVHGRCRGLALDAECVLGASQCDSGLYCADPLTGKGPWPGPRHMSRAEAAEADESAPRGKCRPPRKVGETCSGDWQCSLHGVMSAQDDYFSEGLEIAAEFVQRKVLCNIVLSETDENGDMGSQGARRRLMSSEEKRAYRQQRHLSSVVLPDDFDDDQIPYWLQEDPMIGHCTAVNSLPIGAHVIHGGDDLCIGQDTIAGEDGTCTKATPEQLCSIHRMQVPKECEPLLVESNVLTSDAVDNLFGRVSWRGNHELRDVQHLDVTKKLKCCMWRNRHETAKWSATERMNEYVRSLRDDVKAALQTVKDKIDSARSNADEAEMQHLRESAAAVFRFEDQYRAVLDDNAHDPNIALSKLCDEGSSSSTVIIVIVIVVVVLLLVVGFVLYKRASAAKSQASLATGFLSLNQE